MRRILVLISLFALGLLPLASCQNVSPVELPPLSFKEYLPIYMSVSRIEVVEEYTSPMTLPNVEHLIPYSPAEAMKIWADQRLRAVGADNTLQIIIKNGPVTVHSQSFQQDWPSFFTGHQDKRYEAQLEVELRIYNSRSAMSQATVTARAKRSVVINDDVSVLERDAAFRKMIKGLMTEMNAALEENMYRYMANYISFSYNP